MYFKRTQLYINKFPRLTWHICMKYNAGCAQICLEKCEFNVETLGRSCETSCDFVAATEGCNEDNPPETSSQECDKSCECDTKEKNGECKTLCSSESSSCENGDCMTVPPLNIKLERPRIRNMCEIPNLHHRRQLRRLAKMRAISAMSHVDVSRSRTPHHRNQIATKKRYKMIDIEIPYSKSKKVMEYMQQKSLHGRLSGNDKEQRRRKEAREQIYRLNKQLSKKLNGKLDRKTMHTRGIYPFRHSHIKRISEKDIHKDMKSTRKRPRSEFIDLKLRRFSK